MFVAVRWSLLVMTGLSLMACQPEDLPPLPGSLHIDPPTPLPPEGTVTPPPTVPDTTPPEPSEGATATDSPPDTPPPPPPDTPSPSPEVSVTPVEPGPTPPEPSQGPTLEPTLPPTAVEITPTPGLGTSPTLPTETTDTPGAQDQDGDGWFEDDCDDTNGSIYPGATEIPYDGIDQDCVEGDEVDLDNDGSPSVEVGGGDCNDLNSMVGPGVTETCDGVDQDCDGAIDDGAGQPWFVDSDGDTWGAKGSTAVVSCVQPRGYVANAQDCDDSSARIYPGSVEVANGQDDDCDGYVDEDLVPTNCREVNLTAKGAKSGVYVIDPDGAGPSGAQQVYCEQELAGGGWQLVSVRYRDSSTLFNNAICLEVGADCSGHLPEVQLQMKSSPEVLVSRIDGKAWVVLGGVGPVGGGGLIDFMSLSLPITEAGSCDSPSYCGEAQDEELKVVETSGFTPHSWELSSQQVRYGGFWMGEGGIGGDNHTLSLNYAAYCNKPGGLDLSSDSGVAGDMACGDPGAIYFRYP